MLFSSATFLFFFLPVVLIIYYNPMIQNRQFQNIFLLIASVFFYAWGEPVYVILMLLSISVNYLLGIFVENFRDTPYEKMPVVIAGIFNIGVLFLFKYLRFFCENLMVITGQDWNIPNIYLPIGISFYTFQAISYVVDVYRQKGEVQRNPLNVGLYITFFPQLIAGPIVRYETISGEIENRQENARDFTEGVTRLIWGLGKKVLIANNAAILADACFADPSNLLAGAAWIGIISYAIQIYFDFSGYSDMAIGLGRMFGFHFLENFNYPYIASSIQDFWRRWHISLSTWFRDYVYIPLGGSRTKKKSRMVRNLFIVWALTGLWHGANWTFLIWGIFYFVLLLIEHMTDFPKKLGKFGHIYTLLCVLIGWVFFRADSVHEAFLYLKAMAGGNGMGSQAVGWAALPIGNLIFVAIGIIGSTPILSKLELKNKDKKWWNLISGLMTMIVFIFAVSEVVNTSYNPFIYFNF